MRRKREWRERVHDILGAIDRILGYVEDISFGQFVSDTRTNDNIAAGIRWLLYKKETADRIAGKDAILDGYDSRLLQRL